MVKRAESNFSLSFLLKYSIHRNIISKLIYLIFIYKRRIFHYMDINLELYKVFLLRGHDAELFGGFQTAFLSHSTAVSQAVKNH